MPVMSFSPTGIGEIDVGRVLGWQMVPWLPVGVVSLKGLIRREGGAMLGVEGMAMLGVGAEVEPLIVASGAWNREERLISGVTDRCTGKPEEEQMTCDDTGSLCLSLVAGGAAEARRCRDRRWSRGGRGGAREGPSLLYGRELVAEESRGLLVMQWEDLATLARSLEGWAGEGRWPRACRESLGRPRTLLTNSLAIGFLR